MTVGLTGCVGTTFADATRPHAAAKPAAASRPTHHLQLPGGTRRVRLAGGRSFLLFVPRHLHQPTTLVVALGGWHWDAADTVMQMRLTATATRLGAVVAYPESRHGDWAAGGCCLSKPARGTDVPFLTAVRQRVATMLPSPPQRSYLLGFSAGGMMAYLAACADAGWTGIGTVGATLTAACRTGHPFSITTVSGVADSVVPWNGGYSAYTHQVLPPVWRIDSEFAGVFRCAKPYWQRTGQDEWLVWAGCLGGVTVREVRVPGLRHHWPSREVDGWDMGPVLWKLAIPT